MWIITIRGLVRPIISWARYSSTSIYNIWSLWCRKLTACMQKIILVYFLVNFQGFIWEFFQGNKKKCLNYFWIALVQCDYYYRVEMGYNHVRYLYTCQTKLVCLFQRNIYNSSKECDIRAFNRLFIYVREIKRSDQLFISFFDDMPWHFFQLIQIDIILLLIMSTNIRRRAASQSTI